MPAMQSQSSRTNRVVGQTPLLNGLFEAQAMRRPNHPAIECKGRTLTYAELDRLANQYARFFRMQGLGPGRLVALHLGKSAELFGALLGVLKAGAGYVPIDPKFPADRIRSIWPSRGEGQQNRRPLFRGQQRNGAWGRRRR